MCVTIMQQSSKEKRVSFRRWYIGHLFTHPVIFIISTIFACIAVGANLMVLMISGQFIDFIVSDIGDISVGISLLDEYILTLIILFLIRFIAVTVEMNLNPWRAWNASKRLKNEIFDQIQKKPMKFHDSIRSGDLISLSTFDVGQIITFINPGLPIIIHMIIALPFSIILYISIFKTPFLILVLIPFIMAYIWAFIRFNKKMKPVSMNFMQKLGAMAAAVQENINGARIVRAFAEESFEREKFIKFVLDLNETWKKRMIVQARYYPLLILITAIGFIGMIGIFQILYGYLTIGAFVSFNAFLLALFYGTYQLPYAITTYNGALAGARRIYSMENKVEGEETRKRKLELKNVKGHIVFENVSFKYPTSKKPILKNISFNINPGQTIAIVGPTGSGKSSLTQLLLRLYDYEGTIKIDGIDIKDISLESLRKSIGRIEQDIYLFPRSIRENIAIGSKNNTQEEIENAAKLAQAHDFIINDLPKGYGSYVGERGRQLSGGEKQRIAIARTFLRNPQLLILDDSTSSVDSKTEEEIVNAINNVRQGRTMLIITHRLSTIRQADSVIVLKGARIVAKGHHSELIQISPDYRRIFGKTAILPPLKEIDSRTDHPLGGGIS